MGSFIDKGADFIVQIFVIKLIYDLWSVRLEHTIYWIWCGPRKQFWVANDENVVALINLSAMFDFLSPVIFRDPDYDKTEQLSLFLGFLVSKTSPLVVAYSLRLLNNFSFPYSWCCICVAAGLEFFQTSLYHVQISYCLHWFVLTGGAPAKLLVIVLWFAC